MSRGNDPSSAAYQKAVELLARRQHFGAELAAKLTRRGFAADEVAGTIERLGAQGYLDEEQTARAFVAERRRRNGWGPLRLHAELLRRGAAAEAVAAVLAELDLEEEMAGARRAAERWARAGGGEPASLARHLERKGFSSRVILPLVRGAGSEG